MEKIITICEKPVTFRATGGIGYRYKSQFGREYIADAVELENFINSCTKDKDGNVSYDVTKLSLELMYNILWTMAKTADSKIPPPQEWLDSFDTFPVFEIFAELQDIMSQNLQIDRKN